MVSRDPLVRSGLAAVLSAYPGLVLKEALADVSDIRQLDAGDVVVWDEPRQSARSPVAAPVLALVGEPAAAREALRAGAHGALSRSASADAIGAAALAVAAGHWVLDESFGSALLTLKAESAPPPLLSPREQEVLTLLTEGLSNREVAQRLGISHHTAKFHVNAILDKLGATTRTEAVVLAARSGLLTL